jgi:hypothetical protein
MEVYPLVNVYSLLLKIAIDIVDLPSYKMVIFHSYVSLPEGNDSYQWLIMVNKWWLLMINNDHKPSFINRH